VLYWTDREDEAEKEFRKAISLQPDVPLFYCNLGDAVARLNRLDEARERGALAKGRFYLERAARIDPSDARVRRALAAIRVEPPT
jgi:Flp pilus assembly protein TadD